MLWSACENQTKKKTEQQGGRCPIGKMVERIRMDLYRQRKAEIQPLQDKPLQGNKDLPLKGAQTVRSKGLPCRRRVNNAFDSFEQRAPWANSAILGRILGADGKPIPIARELLARYDKKVAERSEAMQGTPGMSA